MCDPPSSGIFLPPVFYQLLSLATSLAMAVRVKDLAQKQMVTPCGDTGRGAGRGTCLVLELVKGSRSKADVCSGAVLPPGCRPASRNGPRPREALTKRGQPGHLQLRGLGLC